MRNRPIFFVVNPMSMLLYLFSYKPGVERSMLEVSQYSFLWANLTRLNSVKNDSVQEIYLPVRY